MQFDGKFFREHQEVAEEKKQFESQRKRNKSAHKVAITVAPLRQNSIIWLFVVEQVARKTTADLTLMAHHQDRVIWYTDSSREIHQAYT